MRGNEKLKRVQMFELPFIKDYTQSVIINTILKNN